MTSQITENSTVCSSVCPWSQQRNILGSTSLALCDGNLSVSGGFCRKGPVKRKTFFCDVEDIPSLSNLFVGLATKWIPIIKTRQPIKRSHYHLIFITVIHYLERRSLYWLCVSKISHCLPFKRGSRYSVAKLFMGVQNILLPILYYVQGILLPDFVHSILTEVRGIQIRIQTHSSFSWPVWRLIPVDFFPIMYPNTPTVVGVSIW